MMSSRSNRTGQNIPKSERKNIITMSMETSTNPAGNKQGWIVTIAGTCALLSLGVLYAWSVLKANIPDAWNWADSQKSLPYSTACVIFSLATILGAKLLGTDINRRLGEIVAGTQITVLLNEPSLLNGMYRIIIIQSPAGH